MILTTKTMSQNLHTLELQQYNYKLTLIFSNLEL
jgi:hypothetical protein